MLTSRVDRHLHKMVSILADLQLLRSKIIRVEILADLNSREELSELFELHPEGTIVCSRQSNKSLRFFGPAVRVVAPVAFPFETAPWVSDLHEFDFLSALIFDNGSRKETICMTTDKTEFLESRTFFLRA